jgi:hypothetical protein
VRAVPRLCEFYSGICPTTEEKARKNLSHVKKNLSQSTVYILPKTPTHYKILTNTHITKPTRTPTRAYTHYKTTMRARYWILRPGTHYPHVARAHVILRVHLGCERRFNIEFYDTDSHFCHSAYVAWSRVELWSAHVPARLSNFRCRTHFVRRDVRVERSSDVTSCFQKWTKCLLKKCAKGPFYMTPSHQIIGISIWEPTHGKG